MRPRLNFTVAPVKAVFLERSQAGRRGKAGHRCSESWELGVLGVPSELRTSRMQQLLEDIRGLLALLNLHTGDACGLFNRMTIESTKPSPPFSGYKQKHVKVTEGPHHSLLSSLSHFGSIANVQQREGSRRIQGDPEAFRHKD